MSTTSNTLDTTDVVISAGSREKLVNGHATPSELAVSNNGPADKELEDKLTELDRDSLNDSDVKRKSATLTPTSSTEKHSGSSQGNGPRGTVGSHSFSSLSRNNLRRSFTLPRGLLARKSGQTGPVSENQNGSFMKNIFLTLVRTKSVRKPRSAAEESKDETEVGNSNNLEQGKQTNGLGKLIDFF